MTSVPAAVNSLTASNLTESSVQLSWQLPSMDGNQGECLSVRLSVRDLYVCHRPVCLSRTVCLSHDLSVYHDLSVDDGLVDAATCLAQVLPIRYSTGSCLSVRVAVSVLPAPSTVCEVK